MLLFSFISLPAIYLLLVEKITPKEIYSIFIGVLTSSVITIIFWALSTLYNPISITLFSKIVKVFLSSTMPIFLLSLIFLIYHANGFKFFRLNFSFISGFLYWSMLFAIFSNTRRDSDLTVIVVPVVFIIIQLIHFYLSKVKFKKKDNLFKFAVYLLIPFLYVLSSVFSYYSIIALSVFFVVVFVMSITIKRKIKILLSHLISLK